LERYEQFKFMPDGAVASFDIGQILKITRVLGYDSKAILLLIPYAQKGLQEAINKINQKEKQ
jgi:hypothetical protein